MSFKEYLVSTGVSEEQAQQIVDGMPEKDFHIASEEHLDVRFEKMKDKAEQLEVDLETANTLVTDLKKSNADVEGLQQKIDEYETTVATLESERADERKSFAIKEALTKQGVSDVDYMMFKLGDVETDDEGNLVDLDNKLKDLKEEHPTFFADAETDEPADPNGFRVIDNKLDDGGEVDEQPTSLLEAIQSQYEAPTN